MLKNEGYLNPGDSMNHASIFKVLFIESRLRFFGIFSYAHRPLHFLSALELSLLSKFRVPPHLVLVPQSP